MTPAESPLAPRGVWRAACLGPNGEVQLVAVNSKHCEVRRINVPPGDNPIPFSEDLWALLDQVDPLPPNHHHLKQIAILAFGLLAG